jgi:membrane-associated phospholipid phosphatase
MSAIVIALFLAWVPAHAQNQAYVVAPDTASENAAEPSSPSPDSTSGSHSKVVSIARTIGEDELHFIKAPFQKKAIFWDALVVGGTAALVATDQDETILHNIPVSWHQTSRNISNAAVYGTAAVGAAVYFTGLATKNEYAQETGLRTAEATVDSVIMYGVLKVITARQRPFTGEGEGRFFAGNWRNSSFPSGHAMFTWTIASTIAHRYHSIPLDILLYGAASTVSTTRILAGQHFPSDVLVGTVFGYFIGDYIAHKNESGFPIRTGKLRRVENAVLEHVSIGMAFN